MWWYIAVFVVSLILVSRMTPKPQTQPPAGFGDIKAPTAEEGREIPVAFGTVDCEGPNCVGYWNLRTIPVKSKQSK